MKNQEILLDDFTMSAQEYCKISEQEDAEEAFKMQGINGKVTLDAVFSVGVALNSDVEPVNGKKLGKILYRWVCRCDDGSVYFLPLFNDDTDDLSYYFSTKTLSNTGCFEHNNIIFLYSFNSDGKACVRIITMYHCQTLIEALGLLQGLNVLDVYLVKMNTVQENKFVVACWNMVFEDVDENGEPIEADFLMPVDVFEGMKLSLIDFNALNLSVVRENEIIKVGELYFTLKKDAVGKYYLSKNPVQMSGAQKSSRQEAEKLWAELVKQYEAEENKPNNLSKLKPLNKND